MTRSPHSDISRIRWATYVAAGFVALFTGLFAFVLPLTAGRMHQPSAALLERLAFWRMLHDLRSPSLDDPVSAAALVLTTAAAGLGGCLLGVLAGWLGPDARARRLVLGVSAACMIATVFAPPTLNTNPYNFMMRARVAAAYGENPYVTPADEFPDDPLMSFANRRYTDTAGGKLPGWMVWNVAVAWLARGDVAWNLLLLRAVLCAMGLASLFLVDSIARRVHPERALAGLALWGWNPIMIANIQSRTDTVMVFYLLLGMWLLVRGRRHWAMVPLTLSVFVKIFTIPFLAVAALADARAGRWRQIGVAAAVFLVTAVAIWLPFHEGLHGGVLAKYAGLANRTEGSAGSSTSRQLLQAGFAILILVVGWTRRDLGRQLITGWAIVSLYFSVFFAKFASSDYLLTLLAVVAPVMSLPVLLVTGALCVSFFLFDLWYLIGTASFVLPDLFPFSRRTVFLLPLAALPVVGLLLWYRGRSARSRGS